ncbi:bone marrow proteoglycan-like [Pelobates fuscus]|uniref:bone marrow proteoglycan-like n=1 Tax=Pelobates fuscus TaxID=191477 RepID=UPI002FE4507D
MFTFLLMLFLVGSVSAQTIGEDYEEDCDAQENTETSLQSEGNSEECQNISMALDTTAYPKIGSGDERRYYKFFSCSTNFYRAQKWCRHYHGNLSSIHNINTNNFIEHFVSRVNRHVRFIWIGVRRNGWKCQLRNVDGSRLDYTNWAWGNPKHFCHRCTALNISNGKWYSFHCCARLPYICTIRY